MNKVERAVLSAVRRTCALPDDVARELKRSEGFRAKPYRDTKGLLTIGYGTLLDGRGLSRAEAEVLLLMRAAAKREGLSDALQRQGIAYSLLPGPAREALVRMAYQLGVPRLMRFKRMLAAVREGQWRTAYAESLDSKWARSDSPKRAMRVAAGFLEAVEGE